MKLFFAVNAKIDGRQKANYEVDISYILSSIGRTSMNSIAPNSYQTKQIGCGNESKNIRRKNRTAPTDNQVNKSSQKI